ncbi:MAG: SDR family oxidoreductase [Gammaproteobacteria bacterium]|nr:SDR family oxidoreductase [Gammaproteobacteria bacterium]NND55397.1 SDR family oxidoreductase [Gammaproteobacteria bacterium]
MILITGATGKAGGELARQLTEADVPFSAIVRNREKAGDLLDMDADLVYGDLEDRKFLQAALAGIEKAVLVMPNVENQLEIEKQFIDVAKECGVQHIVYFSSLESIPGSTNPITSIHVATEEHLRASGLDWTMIRPAFFMQTFVASAPRIKASGNIVLPLGNAPICATDLRDVAAVIAKVLTEPGHEGKSYDLTGPELVTMEDIAARFSNVLGKEFNYIDLPLPAFREALGKVYNEWRVNAVAMELESIANGSLDHTTDTVQELLGRAPNSIDDFIRDHADLFV